MTRAEWDAEWRACFNRLQKKGYDPLAAQRAAREITRARYGAQPPKPPLWMRIGLKLVGRKLAGLTPAQGGSMQQRIIAAVLYGVAAVISAIQISGLPTTTEGWIGLAGVFVTAAWGKFSSNTTLIAPDRKVWTPEERAQAESKN